MRGRGFARLAAALTVGGVLGVGDGCGDPGAFECDNDVECSMGLCQPNGYCSFDEPNCPSGQIYGSHAPDGLAGVCVPPPGEMTEGPSTATTADSAAASSGGDDTTSSPVATSGTEPGTDATDGTPGDSTTGPSEDSTTGAPAVRVTDGLLGLWVFDAGSGDVVEDLTELEPQMPLQIVGLGTAANWVADGLEFSATGGAAVVTGSSSKVRNGLQATEAFSVEIWVTPAEVDQYGPARLVTLSLDGSSRSWTLLHGVIDDMQTQGTTDAYGLRLATSTLMDVNGVPTMYTPPWVQLQPTHILASRDPGGEVLIWIDGELVHSEIRDGDFSVWPSTHSFGVGNEISLDRAYHGTVHLVAVYDRALSGAEVDQNLAAGY